jgi:hypothetical protein
LLDLGWFASQVFANPPKAGYNACSTIGNTPP